MAFDPYHKWLGIPPDQENIEMKRGYSFCLALLVVFAAAEKLAAENDVAAIITLKGHTSAINSVAFSPDGKRIVSGSLDKTLIVSDNNTGQKLLTLEGHSENVTSVAFSPNSNRIVSGSDDNTVKVWNVHGQREQSGAHPLDCYLETSQSLKDIKN